MGLAISELDLLSIGMIFDMLAEKSNDEYEYDYIATDEDIERL